MILIADSGSTKTEWCVINKGDILLQLTTAGTNPFFQSEKDIENELTNSLFPAIHSYPINNVFFYGAGCAFPKQQQTITHILQQKLSASIEVYSDLIAAARSLCGCKPGIACILGTGANSCLYDGKQIIQQTPALGYILGDEGSGAVLGKRLIGDCLKKQLPEELTAKLMQQFNLTQAIILERVYKEPFPNRFLASLTPFLLENIAEPSIYSLVYSSFSDFFKRNILNYPHADTYPIGFVGSIAYYFQEVLYQAAHSCGLQVGTIFATPMEGLIQYHHK